MAVEKKGAADKKDKPSAEFHKSQGDADTAAETGEQKTSVPESGRRPAHTIDLKAQEVSGEENPGEKASENKEGSAESEGKPQEDKTANSEKETASSRVKEKPKAKPAPPRTPPGELRSFVTHLAAGLIGGLVGVIGVGIGLDKLPLGVNGGIPETGGQSAGIAAGELDEVKRLGKGRAARIDALEEKLAALKSSTPEYDPAALNAMKQRMTRIETTLKTLGETASQGGDVAQTAAIAAQVDEAVSVVDKRVSGLEARLDTATDTEAAEARIKALQDEMKTLQATFAEQAAKINASGENIPAPVLKRLGALEKSLAALSKRADTRTGSETDSSAISRAIGFLNLREAVARGAPYLRELDTLKKYAKGRLNLSALQPHAETGVRPRRVLEHEFAQYAQAVRAALSHRGRSDTLVEQFMSSARSIVHIRRVDGDNSGDSLTALRRMGEKVRSGDLAAALKVAQALPEEAKAALVPWAEQVRARIEVDESLRQISAQLADMEGNGKSPPRQP